MLSRIRRRGSEVSEEKPEGKQEKESPAEDPRKEKHVDEGWKEEARREKERLAEEAGAGASASAGRGGAAGGPLPAASFELLVTHFALQALISLGAVDNPVTRKRQRDPQQAKHAIDLLAILEEKTKGNLSEDEKRHLESTLYDLRMRYVSTIGP